MKIRTIFLIIISLVLATGASAQKGNKKIVITGMVTDASKRPVTNAIIMIDGQNTSAVTDSEGKYRVKVGPTATRLGILTFTNGIIEEAINGRTIINFSFSTSGNDAEASQEVSPGDESINTGYSHVKKKNVTTQVSKVDGTGKKYYKYSNIYDMISRQSAGVKVNGDRIIIQDSKDFFGSIPALLVVDGVPVQSIESISPSSVESIEILKGTSAAIYGSRGFGGAVVIKTKKTMD